LTVATSLMKMDLLLELIVLFLFLTLVLFFPEQ